MTTAEDILAKALERRNDVVPDGTYDAVRGWFFKEQPTRDELYWLLVHVIDLLIEEASKS